MSKGRVADRVAIVTGAGSGIGRASAIRLAQEGAKVVCVDINESAAKLARQHNNANIISIGQRMHDQALCLQLVDTFLETSFSADERHVRRISQISNYENKGSI